jgi:hypothetical protein
MKRMIWMEMRKMLHSRTLLWSVLIGAAISFINVVENCSLRQWFFDAQAEFYSPGYATLSILHNWIDGSQMTVGETIFFVVLPLLAAMPFAWSLQSERNSGYTNQLLTRRSKGTYLTAKYVAVFLSGGIAVGSAMVFNLMANMWILPVCNTLHVLVGYGDMVFLSKILFSKPWLYLLLCLVTSFFWSGTLACLGLTASLFLRRTVAAVLFPFALFLGGSFLLDGKPVSFLGIPGYVEVSPLQLLHAMTLNSNPAWYVWTVLLVLLALVTVVYYLRGMHDEMV